MGLGRAVRRAEPAGRVQARRSGLAANARPAFPAAPACACDRLPEEVFAADDSLGWTYQFWRAAEKKAVNERQVKIGADELPAVTQLFTEPYMVKFLLHNTLGAWWAGKMLAANPDLARGAPDEDALRAACALPGVEWEYLPFLRSLRPPPPPEAGEGESDRNVAASRWHVSGLAYPRGGDHLSAIRAAAAGISSSRRSPFSRRCAGPRRGFRRKRPRARCCGTICTGSKSTEGACRSPRSKSRSRRGGSPAAGEFAGAAYRLGRDAAALAESRVRRAGQWRCGIAAWPRRLARFVSPGAIARQSDRTDRRRSCRSDPHRPPRTTHRGTGRKDVRRRAGAAEGSLAALGMADAAAILARRYTLQATNVPFLGHGRQHSALSDHLRNSFAVGKGDLASAMLIRMRALTAPGGVVAAVTPQSWLFLRSYRDLREEVLKQLSLSFIVALGARSFETVSGEVVNVALVAISLAPPLVSSNFAGLNLHAEPEPTAKAMALVNKTLNIILQRELLDNSQSAIRVENHQEQGAPLKTYASVLLAQPQEMPRNYSKILGMDRKGVGLGIFPDYCEQCSTFWGHVYFNTLARGDGELYQFAQSVKHLNHIAQNWRRGKPNWSRPGVSASMMTDLQCSIYTGEIYNSNCCAIVPHAEEHLSALRAYCRSEDFKNTIRTTNRSLKIEVGTIRASKFDLEHWCRIALAEYPRGLPEPHSDDPTQWLFHGHPRHAIAGPKCTSRWRGSPAIAGRPRATPDAPVDRGARPHRRGRDAAQADADGLLPLDAALGERPLADRLRSYCAAAWGEDWRPDSEARLVAAACERSNDRPPRQPTFEAWLRGPAARQHAKLFHDRPFLWWITDGRADGFTAVAHYHRLGRTNLERLAYSMLNDWITRLGDDPRAEDARMLQAQAGADPRRRKALRHLRPLEAARHASRSAGTPIWTTACA